jgi:hypothetical protein
LKTLTDGASYYEIGSCDHIGVFNRQGILLNIENASLPTDDSSGGRAETFDFAAGVG